MNLIAPHIEAFLREHLGHHRGASQHTCDSYAYSFQLLFEFAAKKFKVAPSALTLGRLNAELISSFLENLEDVRRNSPKTRNIRLAAIRSFFRFLEHRQPTAHIAGAAAVEIEHARGRVEVLGRGAVTRAVEELHRDERVEEIADTTRVQAKFRPEFRPGHAATAKFGEDVELDGGEENLGRPEGEGRLQNWTGIQLRVGALHKVAHHFQNESPPVSQ